MAVITGIIAVAALVWVILSLTNVLAADATVVKAIGSAPPIRGELAAGVTIYRDAFVGRNPGGYVKPFVPGDVFVGLAMEQCVNAGSDGAKSVRLLGQQDFLFTLTGAAQRHVGKPVFATADDAIALTGHPDAFVGYVSQLTGTNTVAVRMRRPGEKPPNGVGSVELLLTGHEMFAATGETAGTAYLNGFDMKSLLGLGILPNNAENGGIKLAFDAVAEVALASIRQRYANLPVAKGITMKVVHTVADKGDNAALDIDWGLGTALTTNSEANIDHADMVQLAAFHMDGNSDVINAQSDDNSTDVSSVDTTKLNDSATDVPYETEIVIRPTGSVEFWVAGVRVLPSTVFAVDATAMLAAFWNMEKTSDDTTAVGIIHLLRVCAGARH